MTLSLSPEMIDAAVLQLTSLIENAQMPDKVRDSGRKFVADLDQWSEDIKKGLVNGNIQPTATT